MPDINDTAPPDHTNREMAAAMRRLGFTKAPMQLTHTAITYRHPDDPRGASFSWAKAGHRVMVLGVRRLLPDVGCVTGWHAEDIAKVPDITERSDLAERKGWPVSVEWNGDRYLFLSDREILLRVARAYAAELRRPVFVAESFGAVVEMAESLGWVDSFPDVDDPDWRPDTADHIEADALRFIEDNGYRVTHPNPNQ